MSQKVKIPAQIIPVFLSSFFALAFFNTAALGHELSGFVGGQMRYFPTDPLLPDQRDQSVSAVLQPEYFHEFENGNSVIFAPFYRLDSADNERTHFDIREMNYHWVHDDFELRFGVGKVFWGVTEVLHLVNIINQIDLVENIDAEDFLGQPMVNLSVSREWGNMDLFVLPFFRERTFPGKKGRLGRFSRNALAVDTSQAKFSNSAEEWHTDFAVRYSHVIGDVDFGIYNFYGTGREPTLVLGAGKDGVPVLVPFYEIINQVGTDITYVYENMLLKFEGIQRSGQGDSFFAFTGGYEYTFTGVFETAVDFGVITEYLYDERDEESPFSMEDDIALGFRLGLNDEKNTEILFAWIQDLNTSARLAFLEASRRVGENMKLSLEVRTLIDLPPTNIFYQFRDDDFVQLDLEYYF